MSLLAERLDMGDHQPDGNLQTFALTGAKGLAGWHTNATMRMSCMLDTQNIFPSHTGQVQAACHLVFQLRSTLANIPSGIYRGHGPILGYVYPHNDNDAPPVELAPCAMLETWAKNGPNQVAPTPDTFQFLMPGSYSRPLRSNTQYNLDAWSKTFNGHIYFGYTLAQLVSAEKAQYAPPCTTGDVRDNNWLLERASESLAIAVVGTDRSQPCSLTIHNLHVHWTPAYDVASDLRALWSRP